jgi:hypothetical protein
MEVLFPHAADPQPNCDAGRSPFGPEFQFEAWFQYKDHAGIFAAVWPNDFERSLLYDHEFLLRDVTSARASFRETRKFPAQSRFAMRTNRGNLQAQLEVIKRHVVGNADVSLHRTVVLPAHVKDELVMELMMPFIQQHTAVHFCANEHFQKAMRLVEADGEFMKTRVNAAREHMVEVATKHLTELLGEMKFMSMFTDGWRRKFEEIFAVSIVGVRPVAVGNGAPPIHVFERLMLAHVSLDGQAPNAKNIANALARVAHRFGLLDMSGSGSSISSRTVPPSTEQLRAP